MEYLYFLSFKKERKIDLSGRKNTQKTEIKMTDFPNRQQIKNLNTIP